MKVAKITYLRGDDWTGMYLDGKLFAEGHQIYSADYEALVKHLLFECYGDADFAGYREICDEDFWRTGRCPTYWSSVEAWS